MTPRAKSAGECVVYPTKILVLPASPHFQSPDARLAALAAKELTLADAEVTRISLADYPMPLYDCDVDALSGTPLQAIKLKQMICAHDAVFLVTSEVHACVPPLLINALDWVASVRERDDTACAAFHHRAFAIASTAADAAGGIHALASLRQILALGCGALVLPEQIAVAHGDAAFDDLDNLRDAGQAEALRAMLRALVDMGRMVERRH
jgi:chromate reductase